MHLQVIDLELHRAAGAGGVFLVQRRQDRGAFRRSFGRRMDFIDSYPIRNRRPESRPAPSSIANLSRNSPESFDDRRTA